MTPQSIPAALRSLEYSNSPVTFGVASWRVARSPTRPRWSSACCSAVVLTRRGRQSDGVEDLGVAGAAAEVAGELLADDVVARVRDALEQRRGRDDEAGRAEAALHGARVDERLLDPVQPVLAAQPFDRPDLVPVGLRGQDEARADELAVEQHRARAALALLARVLRAGQAERVAQRRQQALAGPDVGLLAAGR